MRQRSSTTVMMMMTIAVIIALIATCFVPLISAADGDKTYSYVLKFGAIKPTFFFDTAFETGDWTLTLLTPEYHFFIPHNPEFEPGFKPEVYPEVQLYIKYNSGGLKFPCKQSFVASPTNFVRELSCIGYNLGKVYSFEFDEMAIGLLPTVDFNTQPFPKFRYFSEKENREIIFELDQKPWATTDYQTYIDSSYVYPVPYSYINELTKHLEFGLSINTNRKNVIDETFSLELLGGLDTLTIPQYIFNIHNPQFNSTIPSPLLTNVNMTINSFNTTQSLVTMDINTHGSSLNITSSGHFIPTGQPFSLQLQNVTIIRNPKADFGLIEPLLITPPRLRMKSIKYQADIDYLLNFIPIAKTDFEDKIQPIDEDKTHSRTIHLLIGGIVLCCIIIISLGAKIYSMHKANKSNGTYQDEPLLIH